MDKGSSKENGDSDNELAMIVVPGSFHEPTPGGRYRNVAPVYVIDGISGIKKVFEHQKVARAKLKLKKDDPTTFVEYIDTGKVINILSTPIGLIAIMICMDFCDEFDEKVWPHLDVDYILVPSFGTKATFDLHERRASSQAAKRGSQSVIVQQMSDAPVGNLDSAVARILFRITKSGTYNYPIGIKDEPYRFFVFKVLE